MKGKQLHDGHKEWKAGKARQEELDEIDQCRLCEIIPGLAETCYARKYCHRQIRMQIDGMEAVKL